MILNKVNETIGLLLDYSEKDWDLNLNFEKNDADHSFENFLLNMNELLGKHAPLKNVRKYQLKLKTKPWITVAIHKTILVRNSLFQKYIKLKDLVKKIETRDKYKRYRKLVSTIIKKSKKKSL